MANRMFCAALLAAVLVFGTVSAAAADAAQDTEAATPTEEITAVSEETAEAAAVDPNAALNLTAPSAILIEQSTGTVLYEKNAHERLAPASVTKIMTLLLVMEALDEGRITWDDQVTTSETAAAKGGSQVYLEVGEQMPITDMIKSVCVSSANDCATALAEHVAGSEEAFVAMMNSRAAELGMTDTHFVNCTGLDDDDDAKEHLTSAYDIAIMSRELLKHDRIREFTTIWMDSVRDGKFGLSNTNKLVRFYQGTTGLKTGFTSSAGYCLSASAERDGVEYIAVALHCDTSDHRNSDCKAMLDFAFANYALVTPEPEEALAAVPVKLGTAETVTPVMENTDNLLVGKSEAAAVTKTLELSAEVEAPVEQGQRLGTVTVKSGDTVLSEIPVVAAEAVARLTWWDAAMRIFGKACFS
ncbi:MAG: D-alanyl-D-alanine carboxypeptidase family protein [Oscillospiraceae bacterium]|nr:D-alanyl-D-alanine carboxypeptidase family protein [Oscillospiraceae bacterium]